VTDPKPGIVDNARGYSRWNARQALESRRAVRGIRRRYADRRERGDVDVTVPYALQIGGHEMLVVAGAP
jgi:hypothetical protein